VKPPLAAATHGARKRAQPHTGVLIAGLTADRPTTCSVLGSNLLADVAPNPSLYNLFFPASGDDLNDLWEASHQPQTSGLINNN